MAINLNNSIMEHKKDVLLDPAYTGALERGMLMVDAGFSAAGERLVRPSAAGAGERPVGFLWLSETSQAQVPVREELTVPALAAFTVTLRETPASGAAGCRAYNLSSGATITVVAGAPGAGQLGLTGKVLTADAALAGVEFAIVYEFDIDPAELARRGGRRSVNQGAEGLYDQVTIVYGNCTIYTSCFDPSEALDVAANVQLASGANGDVVLTGGAGTDFGVKVQAPVMLLSPGIEQAFIGISCDLPG